MYLRCCLTQNVNSVFHMFFEPYGPDNMLQLKTELNIKQ